MTARQLNLISSQVIKCAIEVHREIGPGLLESVYENCLEKELQMASLKVERQIQLPINYKGHRLKKKFCMDMLVENEVILELKCVEQIQSIHEVQLLTYLKLADKRLGLLLNFNVPLMKKGIRRKVNQFPEYFS